jgi:hypothetical protein
MCGTSVQSCCILRLSFKKTVQDIKRVNTPATRQFHDDPAVVQTSTLIRPHFPLIEFNLYVCSRIRVTEHT